ncbi:MAG: hypothetical protein H8E37_07100 [Planctomycetes bacterium]|nr:hypothetical protein [Planctomycetota bacterium]
MPNGDISSSNPLEPIEHSPGGQILRSILHGVQSSADNRALGFKIDGETKESVLPLKLFYGDHKEYDITFTQPIVFDNSCIISLTTAENANPWQCAAVSIEYRLN